MNMRLSTGIVRVRLSHEEHRSLQTASLVRESIALPSGRLAFCLKQIGNDSARMHVDWTGAELVVSIPECIVKILSENPTSETIQSAHSDEPLVLEVEIDRFTKPRNQRAKQAPSTEKSRLQSEKR